MVFADSNDVLYLCGDRNKTQEQHLGNLVMPVERIAEWQNVMRSRAKWLEKFGIEFLFMIGPDKQSVYWPALNIPQPDHRNSLLVFRELSDVPWVDPVPALSAAPSAPAVYPAIDSHYDAVGAYVAYRALMERSATHRNRILQPEEDFEYVEVDSTGDLGNKLIPPRMGRYTKLKKTRMYAKPVYLNGVGGNGGFRVHHNRKGSGIGFLCGDSYSQTIFPYIAEHFKFLIHLRAPIDKEFVQSVGPEMVIGMVAERFMMQPPVLSDEIPFEMLFIEKLARGRIRREEISKGRREYDGSIPLPAPVLAAIKRHDALAHVLLHPGQVTGEQQLFMGAPFDAPANADVIVAAYLSWALGSAFHAGWASLYVELPEVIRHKFEEVCPA